MGGGQRKKTGPKPELTEEQKQEIREAFDLFDTEGTGTIGAQGLDFQSPLMRVNVFSLCWVFPPYTFLYVRVQGTFLKDPCVSQPEIHK